MNREQHLKLADAALTKAERLAEVAEHLARHGDRQDEAVPIAAAGGLWNDIARTHLALIAAKAEMEVQD